MRKLLFAFVGLLFCSSLFAQKELDWDDLGGIPTVKEYNEEYDINYNKPIFPPNIAMLEGEEIVVTGYILPLDVKGNYYILSAYPFAACFFCSKDGKAGPETVIELKLKYDYDWFRIDDVLTFKGTLRLNDSDPNVMFYVMDKAQVVSR